MRRGSTLDEALKLKNPSVANEEWSSTMKGRKTTAKLIQSGISATLADIETFTSSFSAHIDNVAINLLALQILETVQTSF